MSAPLAEVFVSFQGEGPLVGVRQAFVRVRGCDIHCTYCDTPHARNLEGNCSVDLEPSGERVSLPNPFSPDDAFELVHRALGESHGRKRIHSIAVTGGEPLIYPEFVEQFARRANAEHIPTYLETGGHRPDDLARVIDEVAFVSLDFKLPGTLREPVEPEPFVDSYRIAGDRRVGVKMVVAASTPSQEVAVACRALAVVDGDGPVILQPVTALGGGPQPPDPSQLRALFLTASEHIGDVRVIPQCHRILGVA